MSMIVKPDSGGHWYSIGERCGYTNFAIPQYDKTLRDFRKEPLLPSVTTVDREKSNFTLDAWKQEQLLMAALTLPEIPGESMDDRIKRIMIDAKEHGKLAAEKGDIFHSLMERKLKGEDPDISEYDNWITEGIRKASEWMEMEQATSEYIEQSFACVEYGYACRIDWSGGLGGYRTLVDFKTQGTKPGKKINKYDSWERQLAANAMAMPNKIDRWINIIVSTTEPGRIEIVEHKDDDIRQAWLVFYHLLQVFTLSRSMGEWNVDEMRYM